MLRKGGKSTSMVSDGLRKVHTVFEDESELVEEYDQKTDELIGMFFGIYFCMPLFIFFS